MTDECGVGFEVGIEPGNAIQNRLRYFHRSNFLMLPPMVDHTIVVQRRENPYCGTAIGTP